MRSIALFFLTICFPPLFSQNQILHYSETTGYDHNTRSASFTFFQSLAADFGLSIVDDIDGSNFDSLQNLQSFELVIFSNTTGDGGLTQAQQLNFEQYIANGGSYLGIHAAADMYRHSSANGNRKGNWDWYAETVAGCSVQNGPNHTIRNFPGTMTFHGPQNGLRSNLPQPWSKDEEWYYWLNGYQNTQDFTVLLEVGQTGTQAYDSARMAAHYRDLPGGGRAFYTSLGHLATDFQSDTSFQQLLTNAVTWIRTAGVFPIDFKDPETVAKINPRLVNPISDKLVFLGNLERNSDIQMDIYTLEGKFVRSFKENTGAADLFLWENDIMLPEGIYVVFVHSYGRGILSEKLIVKH